MHQLRIFVISLFALGICGLSACEKGSATLAEDQGLKSQIEEVSAKNEQVVSATFSLENLTKEQLYAQLQEAAKQGELEKVRTLIKQGADVNLLVLDKTEDRDIDDVYAHYEMTPLMLASKEGYLDVVKELVAAGANVNQTLPVQSARCMIPGENETALIMACRPNNIEVIKVLAASGTDAQSTVLCACWLGNEDLLQLALKEKPNLNFTTGDGGVSPLMSAVEHGYENIVKELLKAGADPNYPDEESYDEMLQEAKDYPRIVELLKQAGAKEGSQIKKEASALKYRIDGELKEQPIAFSFHKGTQPLDDEGNPIPWSALIKEEHKNKAREYQKQIGAGKKITSQELHDALLEACRDKNQYAVKVLLDAGANMSDEEWSKVIREKVVYTDNPTEESPEDINETLVLLLAAKAKADGSSLVEASQCGFSKVVKTLLTAGGIEKKDISRALLEGIAENVYWPENQIEIIQALLEAGADPNTTDEYGYSALQSAKDNSSIIQLLKQAGAKE